jgi:hypothetical protein
MGSTETSSIIVQDSSIQGLMLDGIDFGKLNGQVAALADHSGEMTPDEKKTAISIIGNWENGVIHRLRERADELDELISFIKHGESGYGSRKKLYARLEKIATLTDTAELYTKWIELRDASECDIVDNDIDTDDPDLTGAQIVQLRAEAEVIRVKADIERRRLTFKAKQALIAWRKALVTKKETKEFFKQAGTVREKMNSLVHECTERSQAAKTNVAIASAAIREALKDLLNFQVKI